VIAPELNSIVAELIHSEIPNHRVWDGTIDREAVSQAAHQRALAEHPLVAASVRADAEAAWWRVRTDKVFRDSTSEFALIDRANRAAYTNGKRETRRMRDKVTFRDQTGQFKTKLRCEIIKAEVPLVLQYLNKQRDAYQRDIDWWGEVWLQMTLVDAPDSALVSEFVTEEEAA
jgi:hypothetical protein